MNRCGNRWLVVLLLMTAPILAAAAGGPTSSPSLNPVFNHPANTAQMKQMLASVNQRLDGAAALQGQFTQRNHLHGLPLPLRSSGDFLVARGLGVDWHTLKPFAAEVVLTPQALIQRSGGTTQTLGADQQPGLAAVARTFDAMFTLDLPQLAQRFKLYGSPNDTGWVLGLKPRDAALAAHLAAVVVSGSDHPDQVTLYQAGGDRTEIVFSNVEVVPALSQAQRQRFSP